MADVLLARTRMTAVEAIAAVCAHVPWVDPELLDTLLSLAVDFAGEGT